MGDKTTVVVSADASGYTAELSKAQKSAQAFMATQDQAAQRIKVAQQAITEATVNGSEASSKAVASFVSQLARTADQAGKSRAEILAMRAATLGVSDAASGYIAQIAAASESTHSFSLASGGARRELAVLAHEAATGNWTRFAGSLGVLGERTGAIGLLFSSTGLALAGTAAAAAAFLYEIDQGAKQVEAFNAAITSTGGYLGLSSEQMLAMSNGLVGVGTNLSTVRAAMAQVAGTGAFTADNLGLATEAAVAMSEGIGISTDKAAESLAKIRDGVIKWVTDYQAAHHTFDAAQIDEISGFVKLGDTASATAAVMRDIVSAQAQVEASAQTSVGAVADWWNQLEYSVGRAKDAIMSIGTPTGITQQVGAQLAVFEAATRNLAQQQSMGAMGNTTMAQQQLDIETKKLAVLRDQQSVQFKATKAAQGNAQSGDSDLAVKSYLNSPKYASPAQQHSEALDAENAEFAAATVGLNKTSADYNAALKRHYDDIGQINAEYAKKTKGPSNDAAIQAALKTLAGKNSEIEAEEKRQLTSTKASYQTGAIDQAAYITGISAAQHDALTKEIANAQQRADIAGGLKEKTAQAGYLQTVKNLNADLVANDAKKTTDLANLQKQRADDIAKYGVQQADALHDQAQGYSDQNATRFMIGPAKSDYTAQLALTEEYEKQRQALDVKYQDSTSDKSVLDANLAQLNDGNTQAMAMLVAQQAEEARVRNSYSAQMQLSLVNLGGAGKTNAQLMGDAFTTTMGDMNNALATFVTTGKLNFTALATSILADLAKIALQAAESQIFQDIASSFSTGGAVGTAGVAYHMATGGAIFGAGSGTSDSIPAMLSNGEYVINAAATSKNRSLLESINSGGMAHFATGGAVGSIAPSAASSGGSPVSVTVNNSGGGSGLTNADAKDLQTYVQAFVDKRISQRSRGQGGLAYQMRHGQI